MSLFNYNVAIPTIVEKSNSNSKKGAYPYPILKAGYSVNFVIKQNFSVDSLSLKTSL